MLGQVGWVLRCLAGSDRDEELRIPRRKMQVNESPRKPGQEEAVHFGHGVLANRSKCIYYENIFLKNQKN
jgi:hypothetical protein